MKLWMSILILLVVAVAAALGWQWVVADPGYVLIRLRGTSIETSLVFAVCAVLLLWVALGLGLRLLAWPRRAWGRIQLRRAREDLASGMAAFAEGRYLHAERRLAKAARNDAVRGPALLAMARAAHLRGDDAEAARCLDQAAAAAPDAVLALRARFLNERGRHAEALALLKPQADKTRLAPVGLQALIESALAADDAQAAIDALPALARSQSLADVTFAKLETRVLEHALGVAASAERLNAQWSALGRNQRRQPRLIAAFARRAAHFGQTLAAMDAIESALRHEWNETLALAYGELGPAELGARTRHAEAWLAVAPNSAHLLTTLGRLCRDQKLWGKGIDYLERAVEIADLAPSWEALGDCHAGAGQEGLAARCYANALRRQRGAASVALAGRQSTRVDTRAVVVEERDSHGVPRLPAGG